MSQVKQQGAWTISPPSASALLRLYQHGDGVFVSPACSLLTKGVHRRLDTTGRANLASEARQLLNAVASDGEVEPLLIGSVGFDSSTPPRLHVPRGVVMGSGASVRRHAGTSDAATPGFDGPLGRSLPSESAYCAIVAQAIHEIESGRLNKVVLSRSCQIKAQVDVDALIQRLMPRNLMGYTYSISLQDGPTGTTLAGASPELLLSKRGRNVASHPLAGSVPRSPDQDEDQRKAARLLESGKDLREHAYVVDEVATALAPYCSSLHVPRTPSLVSTPTMWHLGTRIVGELRGDDASALELALALHPTPAVCGHPVIAAKAFIDRHEGFQRNHFAGLVGWMDLYGDGEWAVTIRCAEITADQVTLFAGAGIVAGSDPQLELAETQAKMATLWGAMATNLIQEAA